MGLTTIQEAMELATQRHRAGQFGEAENIYRQILATEPRHADAMQRLGVLALQAGQREIALKLIDQAIEIDPEVWEYHFHRGLALVGVGRTKEAIESYGRALSFGKDFAEVHNSLGNALHSDGQLDAAFAELDRAIALKPDYADAYNNLGNVLQARGDLQGAVAAYRRAIELRPDFAEAHSNLGGALPMMEEYVEAIAACRRALVIRPRYPAAYSNLGYALRLAGQRVEAMDAYRQALALQPEMVEAYNGLGNTLLLEQKVDEAISTYRLALQHKPKHFETRYNLAIALHAGEKLEEAIAEFREALSLRPDSAEATNNLGLALQAHGDLVEAVDVYRQAIALRLDYVDAINNLGNAMKDLGRIEDALAAYDQALTIRPDDPKTNSNRLFVLQYHPKFTAVDILREARKWSQAYAEPLKVEMRPFSLDVDPNRRLRIGYISPDFREHSQSQFMIPLLSSHDHGQVEIFCYSNVLKPDALTGRLRGYADTWRDIVGMPDGHVAELVRADKIDVLVDLTMHMANGRPLLFARRPAPVQVAWLAYPGTTGLGTMDCRLTDPYLDPPGINDGFYSEKTIRLPETFWCYDPLTTDPAVNELPALSAGYVTLGCLNNFCKVNHQTLKLWGKVLAALPTSRLMLLCPRGSHRRGVCVALGVEESRMEFVEFGPRNQYLERYHQIDVGLDTLPYNGHTTSLDSLWMGVPVLTLVGETVVGRAGWSQLCNLNLKELAARSEDQFVKTAVGLAGDLPRLAQLRNSLRQRMTESPLMDSARFARNIESAYREMWRRCVGAQRKK